MPLDVLVTGASGFIGSHLTTALEAAGHRVRAMTRNPDRYKGAGEAVGGDVEDPSTLSEPMQGVDVAYYLVHSLSSRDFEAVDARAARDFGRAAAQANVRRIVYLGGLGADTATLSAHLRSRREVESLLGQAGVPVTVLRAAVVIGHGGISWELTRQLVDHLPLMLAPRWVNTRTQPIALPDVIRYLVGVLDVPETAGRVYDVGGPDVLRYVDMMQRAARLQNHRPLPVITVPLLTPHLSSMWLALVTDVDVPTARNLIDSMTNEVVVRGTPIQSVISGPAMGYDDAVRAALRDRLEADESGQGAR
ncbi:MAG: NAD(P)H-binding protein [Jatrophihabitantaceae bacterium]